MKRTILAVLLTLLLGCSPEIMVYTDHDPAYNLADYRTFGWMQDRDNESDKNPLYYNELNDKRIKTAVQQELTNRGYRLVYEQPELSIHYHIIIEDREVIANEPHGFHYGPYWLRMHSHAYEYREGTLIIDLMDTRTNQLVWRGWAVAALDEDYTPDKIDQLIRTAVAEIFKKFPEIEMPAQTVDRTFTD